MKTIKLTDRPPARRERASDILSAAVVISVLLFSRAALNGPPAAVALPTPRVAPAIVIATAPPQPTWTPAPTAPAAPTWTPVVIIEQAPPPPAEVQFVEVPIYVSVAPVVEAAPTPEPALQTLARPADEEELSPALLREAQDR